MGFETPFREILRRTVGRRPLRQRLSRRHAPRRRHGLHVRNHRQNPFRKRQLDARGGQQQQPRRRAAHLDRHEPLRRHLPRGGTDPHRAHGHFAALPRVGRRARTPADGRSRKGRGRDRGAHHLEGRQQLHAERRHHQSAGRAGLLETPEGAPRRQTRLRGLLGGQSDAVEPARPGALHRDGLHRRGQHHRPRRRPHGLPLDRSQHGRRADDQRRTHTRPRRHALPRQRPFGRHADSGGLRRRPADHPHDGSQRPALGGNAARAVPLRPLRRTGNARLDRRSAAPLVVPGRRLLFRHARLRTERTGPVAGDRSPEHQPPVGGDVGYLLASLDARRRRDALHPAAERDGPHDGPLAPDGRLQRPERRHQFHHRPDRLAAGRRLAARLDR